MLFNEKNDPNRFYVYALLDTRKPGMYIYESYTFNFEPFYIGKGNTNRGYEYRFKKHLYEAYTLNKKSIKCNKINKIKNEIGKDPIYNIVISNITETHAFDIEKNLIKIIGRKDLGLGPLSNYIDGGEGSTGIIRTEESKKQQSISISGDKHFRFGKHMLPQSVKKLVDKNIFVYIIENLITQEKFLVSNLSKFSKDNNIDDRSLHYTFKNPYIRKYKNTWTGSKILKTELSNIDLSNIIIYE